MNENANLTRAFKEILSEIFADGYKKTGIKYDGADVYIATYNKPVCISMPWFILCEDDEVWLADDETTQIIKNLYDKK